ncbi:hTAFII28-like protein conserved region-domain-containing protein [Syncephalis plumigaleata]|nr:hTAFII28-like protein conserved region-domain-containing protein [Syncephalis plumigaleata]
MSDENASIDAFLASLEQGSIGLDASALTNLTDTLAMNMEAKMEDNTEVDEELGSADDLDDDDLDVDLDDLEPIPSGFQPSALFSPISGLGQNVPGLHGLQANMMRELLMNDDMELDRSPRTPSKLGAASPSSADHPIDDDALSTPGAAAGGGGKTALLSEARTKSIHGGESSRHPLRQMSQAGDYGEEEDEEEEALDAEAMEQAKDAASKQELRMLMSVFSEEQLQRYEVYRRSALSKSAVRKLVASILQQTISPTMAFVVAGFTKVFVGEIIEIARDVMEETEQTGPLRPEHLREALRRYKSTHGIPACAIYRRRPPSNF